MSRARQKSKNNEPDGQGRLQALRALAGLLAVTCVVGGVIYALERVKAHVYALPEYNPAVQVDLVDAPEWVDVEGWRQRILAAAKIPPGQTWLDNDLVSAVADGMARSGWVSRVKRVSQCPDGRILIACDFRRPIAMMQTARGFIPVDNEGFRLPEVYPEVPDGTGWIRISGLESATPDVGQRFLGEDAVAGVQLANLLFEQEFASRITCVDMLNFRGRHDKRANHICLRTRDGGKIDWGSAIGEEIEEPSAKDKIRTIALYFKKGSSQAQVDVSVYRNGWIEPAAEPSLRTAALPDRVR